MKIKPTKKLRVHYFFFFFLKYKFQQNTYNQNFYFYVVNIHHHIDFPGKTDITILPCPFQTSGIQYQISIQYDSKTRERKIRRRVISKSGSNETNYTQWLRVIEGTFKRVTAQ